MINYVKKQIAKVFIRVKLKELGIKQQHLTTLTEVGADLYVISNILRWTWKKHGNDLKAILSDNTQNVDIDKVITNIQKGWTDECNNSRK